MHRQNLREQFIISRKGRSVRKFHAKTQRRKEENTYHDLLVPSCEIDN